MEIAVHEIGSESRMLVGDRRPDEPPSMDAGDVQAVHEPGDPLAGDREAGLGEIRPDPWYPVCPPTAGMGLADLGRKGGVRELPC
jgi:hypothetical protein